jgi:hypothetical protein
MESEKEEAVHAPYGYTKAGKIRVRRTRKQMYSDKRARDKVAVRSKKFHRTEKTLTYLKYHRVVFAWARKKYNVTTVDLEMMFFLYDEYIFTASKFKEYSNIMPFDRKKIERMIEHGWVRSFRTKTSGSHDLYELSDKAKKLVLSIYKKLEGKEPISENPAINSIMQRKTFRDKTYAIAIKQMNRHTKEKMREERIK